MKTMFCAARIRRGKLGRDARSSKRRERLIYAFTASLSAGALTSFFLNLFTANQQPSMEAIDMDRLKTGEVNLGVRERLHTTAITSTKTRAFNFVMHNL